MATAIEDEARNNINRKGLPKGYDPIAPTHILGYTSPPIRVRPAGSLSDPSTYGPLIAYVLAFAGLSYLALKSEHEAMPARANPSVEPGTWAMHLQQHVAALLNRLGAITPQTRFRHEDGRLLVSHLTLLDPSRLRAVNDDAQKHRYRARFISSGTNRWLLVVTHPTLLAMREPGSETEADGVTYIDSHPMHLPGDPRDNPTAFTQKQAERAGKTLHVNYERLRITPRILRVGMNVEREHSNITHGSPTKSAKIALAHLDERSDYYARLKRAGL